MRQPKPDLAGIAGTVQRLSILLAAGTAPAAAWHYLGDRNIAPAVARAAASGTSIPEAIAEASLATAPRERTIWAAVAAAWAVALEAGAPLAPTLRELSGAIRDLAQAQREIAVALASPAATARLVLVLPLVGVFFGTLLGFNTVGTLATTPIGWSCLAVGGTLLFLAARWNRRMVRSAEPRDTTPGLELDLLAIAVSGGGAIDRARASVSRTLLGYRVGDASPSQTVEAVLELSRRAGIPAAELLRSEATESRREARAEVAERAQALAVRLMIPLGLCVLPAFMVLSVVPLVVTVLSATNLRP